MSDEVSKPVDELAGQVNGKIARNPEGIGGFRDNPQNINRAGGPKKEQSLTELLRQTLNQNPEKKQKIIDTMIDLAIAGSVKGTKEVFDRMDGKAIQTIVISGIEEIHGIQENLARILGYEQPAQNSESNTEDSPPTS